MNQLVVIALACLAGCIEALAPDVGPLAASACSDADADPATAVSLQRDLLAGVFARCATCHTPSGATPIGIAIGGFDMSSFESLTAGGTRSSLDIVVPGVPCDSVLLQKLGDAPPFGARMPLEGVPLTLAERQLVADWIAEGARDN